MKLLRPCLVITAFLLFVCCVLYPAVVTGAAQVLFKHQADGSLIVRDGKPVGSTLIGQTFDRPMEHLEYFWGRPSAASVDGPTGVLVSGGSNYGPLNSSLSDEVTQRVAMLRATGVTGEVPIDLVTKSGSGARPPHLGRRGRDPGPPRRQGPRRHRGRACARSCGTTRRARRWASSGSRASTCWS